MWCRRKLKQFPFSWAKDSTSACYKIVEADMEECIAKTFELEEWPSRQHSGHSNCNSDSTERRTETSGASARVLIHFSKQNTIKASKVAQLIWVEKHISSIIARIPARVQLHYSQKLERSYWNKKASLYSRQYYGHLGEILCSAWLSSQDLPNSSDENRW